MSRSEKKSRSGEKSSSDDEPHSEDLDHLSMDEVKSLLVETRAAVDVLTEMVCLLYADGDEKKYRETIRALKQRQVQSEELTLEKIEYRSQSESNSKSMLGSEDGHLKPVET